MATGTPHVAFIDLSKQLVTPALCSEKSDGLQFGHAISVVELEDKRVTLTAIDAAMRA